MATPKKRVVNLSPTSWAICETKKSEWGFDSVEEVADYIIKTWNFLGVQNTVIDRPQNAPIFPNLPQHSPAHPEPPQEVTKPGINGGKSIADPSIWESDDFD